jgi:ElaA protein
MHFILKKFEDLSLEELYRILQIRAEVFVVEQDCVYQDLDNLDQNSYHVLGIVDNEIEAYTRIIPPGGTYDDYSSIGRVITSQKVRKNGYGKSLMNFSIKSCFEAYTTSPLKISAQTYLLKFYSELGFEAVGEGYLEDGIPHIAMIYQNKKLA